MNLKYYRPGLDYATAWVIEEMGEVQQMLGKCLRFGWDETWANAPKEEDRVPNHTRLSREIYDLEYAFNNLKDELVKKGWWTPDGGVR